MKTSSRVLTQVHVRKIDRSVAHYNMKRLGFVRVNKRRYATLFGGGKEACDNDSFFSNHWKEYVNFVS